ncbi:MAG: choice-of-anchor Q domain-containing protein [Verrucomicrobiales bacterium]
MPLSQPFHALFRADARTTLSMHQVEVRETRAQAIWVSPDSLLTLDRCRLTENDGHSMVGGFPGGTALAVQGRAYLIESRIDSNYTSRFGAAVNVWDHGFVSCQNCLFDENFAELEAGAIYAVTQGGVALDLIGCTFLENESAQLDGGAIYLNGCDLRATNSSFAANKAGQGSGGAIFFAPGASAEWSEIVHCTLSTNLCGVRGGALGGSGTIELSNSIVAGNDSPLDADLGSGLSVVNPASNLIGGDPQLAPLGDYGGPTPTMPPLPRSPAIDGATDSWEVEDQRGTLRDNFFREKQFPDLGAVEYQRAADLALFWNLDWDGDGSPFGAEFAGGTDALAPDRGDPAHPRLTADAGGHPGITFGIDSSVASDVAWVVRRSTDLIHFEEIYRFDGRAQSETSAPGIIAVLTPPLSPDRISVFDTNPPSPRAFYHFGAVLLAP